MTATHKHVNDTSRNVYPLLLGAAQSFIDNYITQLVLVPMPIAETRRLLAFTQFFDIGKNKIKQRDAVVAGASKVPDAKDTVVPLPTPLQPQPHQRDTFVKSVDGTHVTCILDHCLSRWYWNLFAGRSHPPEQCVSVMSISGNMMNVLTLHIYMHMTCTDT